MSMINMKKLYLGIELGSTRIKCSLIDVFGNNIANGVSEWDNKFLDNYWTYDLDESLDLIGKAYLDLKKNYELKFQERLSNIKCIGISAMMHGLIALDKDGNIFDNYEAEIVGVKAMLKSSACRVLLCDSTKVGKTSTFLEGTLADVDIVISDKDISKTYKKKFPSVKFISDII